MSPLERALQALSVAGVGRDYYSEHDLSELAATSAPETVRDAKRDREDLLCFTRAVLQAIREPSEGMVEAGDRAEMALGEVRGLGVYGTERIWPAMIDAALEEQ